MMIHARLALRRLDWIVPVWPAPARVSALMTTRNGGVSEGLCATMNLSRGASDTPEHIAANHALLREVTGLNTQWISQVHGRDVVNLDSPPANLVGDAVVTSQPRTAAAVRVADCLPVLFCDRAGTRVAAAHAGWRGLAAGVIEATVAAMEIAPRELIAWLGPAIGPTAFEVGDDVRDVFIAHDPRAAGAFAPYPERPGKWLADLFALAAMRLRDTGVSALFGGGVCTYINPDRFFSYRRDKTPGRMAAMVWIDVR
jgi:YfiH family protein